MKSKQQLNNVGIYLRLSKDDEKAGESLSIDNQRKILQRYISEKGWNLVDEYVDDGWSGTNFNRPNVQRLLEDAKSGKVNIILVKDLSRFGRNYIEVGQYVDYIFPLYNIRFIALTDNVDTADKQSSGMEMMPIMNVFNEWHAANTSKKVRAVREANARAGRYQAAFAPYGYIAGTDEKRTPVIDEEVAPIVRRIFELYASGLSAQKISQTLNYDGITAPSIYLQNKVGRPRRRTDVCPFWSPCTILQILRNPIYIGEMAQMKRTTASFKNHKIIMKDKNDWVVIPNAHEAIIDRELWDKCQERKKPYRRGRSTKRSGTDPLSGLIFCPECGSTIRLSWNTTYKGKERIHVCYRHFYNCGAYSRAGKLACTSHYIKFKDMQELVIADIRAHAELVLKDEEKARQEFLKRKEFVSSHLINDEKRQYEKALKRLNELELLIQSTYEDKVLKRVPENICTRLLEKYEAERENLTTETEIHQKKLNEEKQNELDVDEFIKRIKKYVDIRELTRELCLEIIEYITVDEYTDETDKPRNIHIYYKFLDKQYKKSI